MQKISIIDVLNSESFREAQMNIKGEGAHRLNLLLIFEFNRVGRFRNRIECDQWTFANEIGYKTLQPFKKAREALVKAGVWEYHKSGETNKFGIKAGYFSLPEKFLKEIDSDLQPTQAKKETKSKEVGCNLQPTSKCDSGAGSEDFPSSITSKSKEVGCNLQPTSKCDSGAGSEDFSSSEIKEVGCNLQPYIYREIERVDIDIDTHIKNKLKKLTENPNFIAKYKSQKVVVMQIQQLVSAIKALSVADTLNVIDEVSSNTPATDTINYLLTALRDKKARKDKQKQAVQTNKRVKKTYPRKKHVEIATDWSKKKAKHVDFDVDEMKDFFRKFEEENGMNNGEND